MKVEWPGHLILQDTDAQPVAQRCNCTECSEPAVALVALTCAICPDSIIVALCEAISCVNDLYITDERIPKPWCATCQQDVRVSEPVRIALVLADGGVSACAN